MGRHQLETTETLTTSIGTGPDSWGVWFADAPNQVPWKRYLDEVVEAGYEWTELGPYGFLPANVTVLQTELDRRGLRVVASTVMAGHLERPSDWPKVEEQVLRVGELGAALGARYLVLIDDTYFDLATGEQVAPERLDENTWSRLIEATHRVADISRDRSTFRWRFIPTPNRTSNTRTRSRRSWSKLTATVSRSFSIPAITPIAGATRSASYAITMTEYRICT